MTKPIQGPAPLPGQLGLRGIAQDVPGGLAERLKVYRGGSRVWPHRLERAIRAEAVRDKSHLLREERGGVYVRERREGVWREAWTRCSGARVLWEQKHGPLGERKLRRVCGVAHCIAPGHHEAKP